jgi:hypothetical protein
LTVLWVDQALRRHARRQTLGDNPADARTGNRSVRYLAVLAEHAGELFAAPAQPAPAQPLMRSARP